MFRSRLHPSPFGLAAGLVLVALWAAFWIGTLSALLPEAQARGPGRSPDAARVVELSRTI